MLSVVFVATIVLSVLMIVLLRLVTTVPIVLFLFGVLVAFVLFNVLQIVLFRTGVLRLTNINAADDLPVSLSPNDPDALAKAEEMVRSTNLAGSTKVQRAAQAQQLKESLRLAKSLRKGETSQQEDQRATRVTSQTAPTGQRCRFARLSATNDVGIRRMSSFATRVVRESYDPILGAEQSDYLVARSLSPQAIAQQLADGHEFYFVLPPKQANAEQRGVRPLGFISAYAQGAGMLRLSNFALVKGARGKGYARIMMRFVVQRARKLGCNRVTLCVSRNNYQAILAFEHLGFTRVGEQPTSIGGGYTLDDLVYELAV